MAHEQVSKELLNFKGIKRTAVGTSGTDYSGNRFDEEYLSKLTNTEAADIWDEMRRSDDQIAMLLRVVSNPIISARWFISPADDSDEAKKIADFITFILFEDMGTPNHPKSFEKFKKEALTSVPFGYALFEITNKIVFDDEIHGTYIGLKGLDWRSPRTIEEWFIAKDGELLGVRQIDSSQRGQDVVMDGRFILHIAADMEGDLYEGISMLRPIYGNWLRKDFFRKINMIGFERAATGVPVGVIPSGQLNTPSQTALEDSLSKFVSHERQFMTIPEGYKIDSLKIEHDGKDVGEAINAENVGMTKSFLANFMELGLSGSGSWALGRDLSDIFLSGIEVYGNAITTPINLKLIPHLVKINFGKQRKYPTLKIEGINDKVGKEFAEVLGILKENGLIQVTDRLKESLHKKYNLPDFDKDFVEEVEKGEEDAEDQKKNQFSEVSYNLAEKNVSVGIEKAGKQMSELMAIGMQNRGNELVSNMMEIWRNTPNSKRKEEVNRLKVPGRNDYKKVISEALAETYVQADKSVRIELSGGGLKLAEEAEIRDLPAESKSAGSSQADLLVETQDADIRKNLFFSFTSKVDTLPTEAQMNANLLDVVNRYVTGASIRTAGPNAIANAVNLARNAVFQKKEILERIESFVFTNPSPKAAICIHLKNRVFTKEEYIITDKLPPLHHNCNSFIVAQITGRKGIKPLSPAGLSIQGSDNQIEQLQKSITL